MGRESQRQQQRDQQRDDDQEDDRRGTTVARAEDRARHQHEVGAEEGRDRADRRRDRVHRDDLLAGHHIRQGGRKPRSDEPGEAVDHQRAAQHEYIAGTDRQADSHDRHRHHSAHVGGDQHQASVPAVHQRTGERTEQRIRQKQHGERAGDRQRAAGALGVEQQRAGQARLKQAVAELACRPQLQQPPKVGQAAHRTPDSDRRARMSHCTYFRKAWGPAVANRASGAC